MTKIALWTIGALLAFAGVASAQTRPAGKSDFEFFGALTGGALRIASEDSYTVDYDLGLGPQSAGERAEGSRVGFDFGWGLGVRAARGQWGIEAAYRQVRSRRLTPGYLGADAGATPDIPEAFPRPDTGATDFPRSRGDLYFGQFFRRLRLRDGATLSLGIGGGYLQVEYDTAATVLGPVPTGVDLEYEETRGSPVYGGSAALTMEFGRVLVRPRLDAVIAARRLSQSIDFDITGVPDNRGGTLRLAYTATSEFRPVFFLLSVEIALRN